MNGEKIVTQRNNVGNKVLIGLVSTLIVIIMGFSIQIAGKANDKADTNTIEIKGMEVEQRYTREAILEIKRDIGSIKQDIKILLRKRGL